MIIMLIVTTISSTEVQHLRVQVKQITWVTSFADGNADGDVYAEVEGVDVDDNDNGNGNDIVQHVQVKMSGGGSS